MTRRPVDRLDDRLTHDNRGIWIVAIASGSWFAVLALAWAGVGIVTLLRSLAG